MSLFLRKQVTWKFSFIKWKFPRWILTFWYFCNPFHKNLNAFNSVPAASVIFGYNMLNKVAIDCRYSMYCWIVENTVHLWYHGKKLCFCCFQRLLSWIASFTDFRQPFTYCGDGLIIRIPFSKAKPNEEERTELCFEHHKVRCVD